MIGMKRRKPKRIIKRSKFRSKFGNYDYDLELECGHIIYVTRHYRKDPMRQPYYMCWKCSEELSRK